MHGIYDGASMRGKLVSIEGIDGCGKTTHTRLLAEWLRSQGYRVVVTDEPTDGIIGRIIKRALKGEIKIQVPTEALLFAADRVQHVDEVIRPALKAGRIVITERYFYSSLAYQSARGLSMHWLESINRAALKPNLSILIDLPSDDALQRIKGSRRLDKFERDLKLQRLVRSNYLRIARLRGLKIVNGARNKDEVQADIRKIVSTTLLAMDRIKQV
jgi:dTMP kinase